MGRMMGRSTVQFEVLELPAGPDVQQNNWDFSDKRLRFPLASRLHSTAIQILTSVPYVNAFFNMFPISAKAASVVGKASAHAQKAMDDLAPVMPMPDRNVGILHSLGVSCLFVRKRIVANGQCIGRRQSLKSLRQKRRRPANRPAATDWSGVIAEPGLQIHDRIAPLAIARGQVLLSGLSKKEIDTMIHLLHVLLKNLPAVASMPADKY
jgi:hypothetical protein